MFKGLVVLLLVFASVPGVAAELVGRATVTDGDTLTVAKQRIRLWGIDAPEAPSNTTPRTDAPGLVVGGPPPRWTATCWTRPFAAILKTRTAMAGGRGVLCPRAIR